MVILNSVLIASGASPFDWVSTEVGERFEFDVESYLAAQASLMEFREPRRGTRWASLGPGKLDLAASLKGGTPCRALRRFFSVSQSPSSFY
jgi:hypothetical protein